MEKNLYIDASHPDETRIVLKSKNHIEEYEYENKNKLYLKNNIYLGKVSRIEPSLQAAFVNYGKQRHGFLAFNDIQTDYYQIPHDDKARLKKEEENLRLELKEKSKDVEENEKKEQGISNNEHTNNNNNETFKGFETVGGMHSLTASFIADGIGEEWSEYLDDTIFFISGAMSISKPDKGEDMFHTSNNPAIDSNAGKSETGYSIWTGLNMPSLISEDGKWGIEYNWGSQYWRSITYAEDTLIGSKLATRGSAYEIYFTEPLVDDILSLQVRYTYINYEYTGSNGFFGYTSGASIKIDDLAQNLKGVYIDKAQDIRFYLRYRY